MSFVFESPTSVEEALALKAEHRDDAVVLAGGQSLLILIRQGLVAADVVISLDMISEMGAISTDGDVLTLGAMARYTQVAASQDVSGWCAPMATAAGSVGSLHIRNRGTAVGALCHADPAGDVSVVALVSDAELVVAGPAGSRRIPVDQLFTGLFETSVADDEIALRLEIPEQAARASWGYHRYSHREGEYPMCVAAARLTWDAEGACSDARIAVGGAGPHPVRLRELESVLTGTGVGEEAIGDGLQRIQQRLEPLVDVRGGTAWKRVVVTRVLKDTLTQAARDRDERS